MTKPHFHPFIFVLTSKKSFHSVPNETFFPLIIHMHMNMTAWSQHTEMLHALLNRMNCDAAADSHRLHSQKSDQSLRTLVCVPALNLNPLFIFISLSQPQAVSRQCQQRSSSSPPPPLILFPFE